ncbi:1,4-beta-D-xylan synthase [Bertholletia excelsa]
MASTIRRTLSPVPRPGSIPNGETCSVASPLSKSSSCTQIQNYTPPVGMWSSFSSFEYAFYRAQTFILGLFSKRSSRSLERPKPKGQSWIRSLLHLFICFMVGVFFGITPFASSTLSVNLMSKHHAFSFDMNPPLEKRGSLFDVMPGNVTPSVESSSVNSSITLKPNDMKQELQHQTSDDTVVTHSLDADLNATFHKLLIVVTPTYARAFQAYYLNRLAHTLKLIPPPLLWIIVDMNSQSAETADLLRRTGIMYRHLVCKKNLTDMEDRGVHQRNIALSHIETHRLDGIVFFADDDNIYSIHLFPHMRQIRRFGTWKVAKLMEKNMRSIVEGPICNRALVIGWHTNEVTRRFRRFHAEMSGFAFNSTILWDPKRWHRPTLEPIRQLDMVNQGLHVSTFIEQVVEDESQMECLPEYDSRIMVWHLHVESSYSYPLEWFLKSNNLDVTDPLT